MLSYSLCGIGGLANFVSLKDCILARFCVWSESDGCYREYVFFWMFRVYGTMSIDIDRIRHEAFIRCGIISTPDDSPDSILVVSDSCTIIHICSLGFRLVQQTVGPGFEIYGWRQDKHIHTSRGGEEK